MEFIKAETNHVTGLIGRSGDPSPVTAYGVYRGVKACARYRYGSDSLAGKSVALQGCGSVGYHLAKLLFAEGAVITCTDIDPQRVKRDRKSTRLNSSHGYISYAVFCLKKKKKKRTIERTAL